MLLQHVIVEPSNMLDHDTYRVISFSLSLYLTLELLENENEEKN